ncbi:MAG TPA: autotransporter-associated beta strand repeat-containing protein [Opitutaceae bacterium]
MKPAKRCHTLLALASLTALTTARLNATDLTWNGGTGDWNTTPTNLMWNSGSMAWINDNDNPYSALFNTGTSGTVTLKEAITVNNITFDGSPTYTIAGSTLTINGTITAKKGATITSIIAGTDLIKAGASNLTLNTAANIYTGNTYIQSATLIARGTASLPTTTTVIIGSGGNNAALGVRASQTVAGISNLGTGTATITGDTSSAATRLTINSDGAGASAADSTFTGVIKDADATHILGITKAGSRTLTLTAFNDADSTKRLSYSGTTIVSGGTLKLGSSLHGTASVTVSGSNDLSGNLSGSAGNINLGVGAVSVGQFGVIAPGGDSIAGSFTLAADQNFTSTGGTLLFDLGASFDQIIGSGTGSFSLTDTTLALSGATSVVGTYALFSGFGGSNSVSGLSITGLGDGYIGSLGTDGILTVSAIPEPSTVALAFGATALVAGVVIRRRRAGS